MADEPTQRDDGLIPIVTIESQGASRQGPFVPRALTDDPDTGDGSTGRAGVPVSKWRLRTLDGNRLGSVADPSGRDRRSRRARRTRMASRKARSAHSRKTRRIARAVVATIVVLLICGIIALGVTYALEMWGGRTVPNVVGLAESVAVEQLEERGFKVDKHTVPSDLIEGHVVSASPEAGLRIPTSQHIQLEISASRKMPAVVGKSRDEACDILRNAGVTSIRYELRAEEVLSDTVLEVRPAEGAVFMTTDTITLVVSQLPDMPDVLGLDRATAAPQLEIEGIPVSWEYEPSDYEHRLRIVRTDPEADVPIPETGITVFLGDPLSAVERLIDYFDSPALHAVEFLQENGFTPQAATRMDDGHVAASFQDEQGTLVAFLPNPWSHGIERDNKPFVHVVNSEMLIEGVRLRMPNAQIGWDASIGEETARAVMEQCGFPDMVAACTQDDIVLPADAQRPKTPFYCCYGESGDYVWTVLLRHEYTGNENVDVDDLALEAVATCAPKSAYDAIDLSGFGDRICDYVAYQDEVLS